MSDQPVPAAAPGDNSTKRTASELLLDDFLDRMRESHEVLEDLKNRVKEQKTIDRELMAEMKGQGFDTKALTLLAKLALETPEQRGAREEMEQILDGYKAATGLY